VEWAFPPDTCLPFGGTIKKKNERKVVAKLTSWLRSDDASAFKKKVRESFSPLRKTTRGERIYLSPHTYIRKRKESLDKNTRWLRIASAPSPPWPTVSIASSTDSSFFLFSFGFRRRNCIQVFGGFGGTITWWWRVNYPLKTHRETEKLKKSKRIQCAELIAIRCVLLAYHLLFVSF